MDLRQFWHRVREKRMQRFLEGHADIALSVLRQDPSLAAEALHRMYAGDAAFVGRINELEAARGGPQRETLPYPVLTSMGFGGRQPLQRTLPKLAPWSLRRFAEFPPAREAINAIKNPILDLPFRIGLKKPLGAQRWDTDPEPTEEQQARIVAAMTMLQMPNEEYTGREFLTLLLEDMLTLGAGPFEVQTNRSDERPLFLWGVDAQSIRLNTTWKPGSAIDRYSQARAYLFGPAGTTDDVWLKDEELCYVKLNPRSNTPFGLGPLEVAFATINAWIGSFEYAERRASNSTPNYMLFLGENVVPEQVQRFRHYWENEIEGFGKIPITGGGRSPAVLPFTQGNEDPLWLKWQEWLTRVIFMAFGLSPMKAGLERDVNRSTADVQAAQDWASIAPVANTLREAFTHWLLWRRLGWTDLEFTWQIKTADEEKQARILAEQWESDAIYVDELRDVYERAPLPDGLGQMTKSAYEAAIKAAAGLPGRGSASLEDEAAVVTPFADIEEGLLSPQERTFLREARREQRRKVAG